MPYKLKLAVKKQNGRYSFFSFFYGGVGGGGANAPGGFGPEFGNITMMDIAYISISIVEIGCLKPKYVLESHTSLYVCMYAEHAVYHPYSLKIYFFIIRKVHYDCL